MIAISINSARLRRRPAFSLAMVALAAGLLASCATPSVEVTNPDFSRLSDGRWAGSYKGKMGSAEVVAMVASGRLASVELADFQSSPVGRPARAITGQVVAAQSLNVDVISGASYSSKVILRAIQEALAAARRP